MPSIARELGVSVHSLFHYAQNLQEKGEEDTPNFYEPPAPCPGQPRCIPKESDTLHEAERRIDAGEAHDGGHVGCTLFPDVPVCTVCQTLMDIGLEGCIHHKKPLLPSMAVKKRKIFASIAQTWTWKQWKYFWFSDKAPMSIVMYRGASQYCCRRLGRHSSSRTFGQQRNMVEERSWCGGASVGRELGQSIASKELWTPRCM
jgi:hypothetical protein